MAEQKAPGSPSLRPLRLRGVVSSPGTLQPNGPARSPTARLWFGGLSLRPRSSSRSSPRAAGDRNPRDGDSSPCPGSNSRPRPLSSALSAQTEELFEMIAASQSQRINDQRASTSCCPKLSLFQPGTGAQCGVCCTRQDPGLNTGLYPDLPNEEFFNMLIQYQSSRIEDQRCDLPEPHEVLFSLVQRVQGRRIDDQRAAQPPETDLAGPEPASLPGPHTEPEASPAPCGPPEPPLGT